MKTGIKNQCSGCWATFDRGIVRSLAALLLALAVLSGCATTPDMGDRAKPSTYSFWPLFPAEPRIQFLTSYALSTDIEPPRSSFENLIYGEGSDVLLIQKPYGVDMREGKIYVCDIKNPGIVILDLVRHETRLMTTGGVSGLSQPTDLAVAPDGMIYVADVRRGQVFVFDERERHVGIFGRKGMKAAGVAVHGDELYVCDFATQSIVVLDRFTGDILRSFGGPGSEDGQFIRPLGIDVDEEGNIYVVDVIRCRLQKFSPQGKFLQAWGQISDTAGSFVRPKHIAVDEDDIVYVVDAAFGNVQMFNKQGKVLMFFGSAGNHPGHMDLPVGLCVNEDDLELFKDYIHPAFDAQRLIVVTNQFGPDKVSVYAMGQLKEGYRVQDISSVLSPMASGILEDGKTNTLTDDLPDPPPSSPEEGNEGN